MAWKLLVEDYPALSNRDVESKSLRKALTAFYKVVTDAPTGRGDRNRKQKVQRRRACNMGWALLSQEMQRNKELRDPLMLARTYLSAECAYPSKSIQHLRRFAARNKSTDPLFYETHFWFGEALLSADRGKAAITHYRWILGELEAELYPLALLRTAHCHWDTGNVEEAHEFLMHVDNWIGDKTSPLWVRSLKQRVQQDLRDFSE